MVEQQTMSGFYGAAATDTASTEYALKAAKDHISNVSREATGCCAQAGHKAKRKGGNSSQH